MVMAFDSGETQSFKVYALVWSIWTYPIVVLIAAIFRHKAPVIAFLPFLNVSLVIALWKLD